MKSARVGIGVLVALALVIIGPVRALRAADEADPVKVCLKFSIPDDKNDAVKAAVGEVEGVRDATVEKGLVCFTVAEEKKVNLSQVVRAVEGAAGEDAKLDRAATTLGGTVELDCAGLNREATDAAVRAIGGISGVEKAEKTSSGHVTVKCASPKGAALADIEKAVMAATKSSEGWTVRDLTWTGPKKAKKPAGDS